MNKKYTIYNNSLGYLKEGCGVIVSEPMITKTEAKNLGMVPLSIPILSKTEQWIILNMASDLRRLGIKYAYVEEIAGPLRGVSIWKSTSKPIKATTI